MKRLIEITHSQNGALAAALAMLVVASTLALLHALGAGNAAPAIIAPILVAP